ncbi:hypothetical protein PITC_083980 [Penicillium italicum]|uniref:Uncharacterized protein n=1 Tax=Penicillium italicum TaxID=40296 RepID=A0A0A2L487_PENIT|nr:hypothetical protein PITC_083980 [Penicillium italicum]
MEPNPRGYRGFGEDPFHPQSSTSPDWLEDDHLRGYHPGLSPRNADAPQHNNRNPTDINEIMDAIRADIGVQTMRSSRGARGPTSPHALSILSAILNMSRSGDAVYSQQELDRVISQLLENTGGTSTAAPPASDAAVQALPKKKVDEEMMGSEEAEKAPLYPYCTQRSFFVVFITQPTFPTNFTAPITYAGGGAI